MNKESKKYYKEIKTLIPTHGKYERQFIADYKARILEYTEQHPDATYSMLCETLGNPREIIHDYYSNVDTTYLIKRLHTTRIIRIYALCALLLILLGLAVDLAYANQAYNDFKNSIITHEKIIIY